MQRASVRLIPSSSASELVDQIGRPLVGAHLVAQFGYS